MNLYIKLYTDELKKIISNRKNVLSTKYCLEFLHKLIFTQMWVRWVIKNFDNKF